MKKLVVLALLATLLSGCARWLLTDGRPYADTTQNISIELPAGWQRLNHRDYLFATRDGGGLQSILAERIHAKEELSETKKKLTPGMLPQELAGVILDNTKSRKNVFDLKILENKPASIGGHQGFRVLFTHKDQNGLLYKNLYYGFMNGEWFYGVRFRAPERHYFDKDVAGFEKAVKSFRLLSSI